MKKAKEYAQDIIDTFITEDESVTLKKVGEVCQLLFAESEELYKIRKIRNYGPMLAVLKEQHLKWQAICRHVNKEVNIMDERGFLNVIESKMTMIYPNLIKIL